MESQGTKVEEEVKPGQDERRWQRGEKEKLGSDGWLLFLLK